MDQTAATRLYRSSLQLAFNLIVVVLVLGLFVGVFRVLLNLGLTLAGGSVPEAFNTLITDALTLLVVIELVRTFVDYFEWHRVRLHALLDAATIFVLREFIIGLYGGKVAGGDVVLWSGAVLGLVAARTLAVRFGPGEGAHAG